VYKGLWNEVQDVAVKMVVGQSAEQQARFLREVGLAIPEPGSAMHVLRWRHDLSRIPLRSVQGLRWVRAMCKS
jgi:hypothetical protein